MCVCVSVRVVLNVRDVVPGFVQQILVRGRRCPQANRLINVSPCFRPLLLPVGGGNVTSPHFSRVVQFKARNTIKHSVVANNSNLLTFLVLVCAPNGAFDDRVEIKYCAKIRRILLMSGSNDLICLGQQRCVPLPLSR